MTTIIKTELPLPLLANGKVRDVYELPDTSDLLFIATDRISCFDVILKNGVPEKGAILNALSEFWFTLLTSKIPELPIHFVALGLPDSVRKQLSPALATQLQRCSMVVRQLKPLPIESIVRGYITGSAWFSYSKDSTVCGIKIPKGLRESEQLERPLWTPSTKAPAGEKDENISPEEAARIVGEGIASQVERLSLQIYQVASAYARLKGIIIADTKFEFGLDETTSPPTVVLIDEVLTPDSSRFWSTEKYEIGKSQESLDKQPVRDWLLEQGLKGIEGVEMTDEVVEKTTERYKEAYRMLTDREWKE